MTEMTASKIERAPDWQLLAEFAVESLSGSEQILTGRVAETVQCLSLKPEQLERIYKVMTQALNRARRSQQLVEHLSPVSIRIWSSIAFVEDGGWGFFVVEKQGIEPRLATVGATCVVELFLYQERYP